MKNATTVAGNLLARHLKGLSGLIAAVGLILSQQSGLAAPAPKTFTGTGGSDWNTAGHWSPTGVPDDTNVVYIGAGGPPGDTAMITNTTGDSAGDLIVGQNFSAALNVRGIGGTTTLSVDDYAAVGAGGTVTLGQNGATGTLTVITGATGSSTMSASGLTLVGGFTNFGAGSGVLNVTAGAGSSTFEGALYEANGGLTLDAWSGQSAQLNVTGSGTGGSSIGTAFVSLGNGTPMIVGGSETGTNTVTLTTGGFIDGTTSQVVIGEDAGSSGTVNVGTGVGDSAHMNAEDLLVGDSGTGTLNVNGSSAGVYAFGEYAAVGYNDSGVGIVNLTNGGAFTGQSGTELLVGDDGTATFNVGTSSGDSAILTMDTVYVGDGSTGTLNGDGTGSITYVTTGNVNVGLSGSNGIGTINLTNGATFNANSSIGTPSTATGKFDIGVDEDSAGIVNVGEGGAATLNADSLVVGDYGNGTLNVIGSGAVVNVKTGNVTVGANYTYDNPGYTFGNGYILIHASGELDAQSTTGTPGTFDIGNNGISEEYSTTTNVVQVGESEFSHASLLTDNLTVGDTSVGNLFVDGDHAVVTVGTGDLTVGNQDGSNGEVNIYGHGTVNANTAGGAGVVDVGAMQYSQGYIVLGEDPNGDTSHHGTLNADTMIVGDAGHGSLYLTDHSHVTIHNGGLTPVTNALIIGNQGSGNGEVDVFDHSNLHVSEGNIAVGTQGGTGLLEVDDAHVGIHDGDLNIGGGNVNNLTGTVEEFDHSYIWVGGNTNLNAGGEFIGGGFSTIHDDYINSGLLYINNNPLTPDITTFTINGNYVGEGGTIEFDVPLVGGQPTADELTITDDASGNSKVHINNFDDGQGGQTSNKGILLITVDGTNTGTYTLDSRVQAGLYDYNLVEFDDDVYLQSHISPEVVGAASIATSIQLLEAASLDTLQQRFGELDAVEAPVSMAASDPKDVKDVKQVASPTPSGPDSDIWSRGVYQHDEVHTSYGLSQDSGVGQIGGDYRFIGLTSQTDVLYLGGFADYGQSSGRVTTDAVDLEGEDIGFGLYSTYANGGFYADGVVKGNFSHSQVKTQYGDFGASGSGVAASLETGYGFNMGSGYMIEPQAQITYQYESYNNPADDVGRQYNLNDPDYLQTRVGVRFDKTFTYSEGLHFTPYLRTGWLYQALGDNQTTALGQTFTEDLGGSTVEVDGGFTLDVCKNVAIYASGNSGWGDRVDSYGGSGGVKFAW